MESSKGNRESNFENQQAHTMVTVPTRIHPVPRAVAPAIPSKQALVFRKRLTLAALALSVLLWLAALPDVQLRAMNDIGLLSVLPAAYYLALIVVTLSFCLNVFVQKKDGWVLPAHLALLIVFFHGTPAILYGTLRYSWAWKHVGVIDYILRHHSVNPNITFLNAYQNWPGFFALNAFFVETAGLNSAAGYASWAPIFFNLLFAAALVFVLRALTQDRRVIWLAAWFFVISNWVGQDYLAPQAFAFFLYLVFLGILFHWFRSPKSLRSSRLRRWLHIKPTFSFVDQPFHLSSYARPNPQPTPFQRTLLMAVVILLMFVVTFTHQLTPLMMIGSLLFLVLFQRIVTRGLLVLMIVLENTWLWFFATAFVIQNINAIIKTLGTLNANFFQTFINLGLVSPGQAVVAWVDRGLTALVFILAGIGLVRRVRSGHFDLAAALLVVCPFFLLGISSYGGEILFRVYYFALPFLALFIAYLILPKLDFLTNWKTTAITASLSLVMITGFLFAYYGKELQYYFTPQEVAAAQFLFNTAPPGSLIVEESGNYPALFHNYEYYTHVPIAFESLDNRHRILQNPAQVLANWMSDTKYKAAYFIITRSQKAEVDSEGELPAGGADRIQQAIANSPNFKAIYQNQDAVIFVLKGRAQ